MEIANCAKNHIEELSEMAYHNYCKEVEGHPFLEKRPKSSFAAFFKEEVEKADCILGIENGQCVGYILYSLEKNENEVHCSIPVWGYGSNSEAPEKTIGPLFQRLAEGIVHDQKTTFSIFLYAHDHQTQRLFSLMQFGIIAEKALRKIEKIEHTSKVHVREIGKDELMQRWDEIWELLRQLIAHLQKSPVFYPCDEFTEDLYKEFLTDQGTTLFIAEEGRKILGLIEYNVESPDLYFAHTKAVNVGEAYVLPEYRGLQIAQALLNHLENVVLAKGIQYSWVEHGTANPEARGFWNKYFKTVEYELIRTITTD